MHESIDRFVEPLKTAIDKARNISVMERSPEANRLWETVYKSLINVRSKATERGKVYVPRIAMIYAALDNGPIIELRHLQAALAVWDYCEKSAYKCFGNPETKTLGDKIKEIVIDNPGISKRELQKKFDNKKKLEFKEVLAWLIGRGDITETVEGKNRSRYFFNAVSRKPEPEPETLFDKKPEPMPVLETKVLSVSEFADGIGKPIEVYVKPASIPDFFDWVRVNKSAYYLGSDGIVQVTNDDRLTPSLRECLQINQDLFKSMVPKPKVVETRVEKPDPVIEKPKPVAAILPASVTEIMDYLKAANTALIRNKTGEIILLSPNGGSSPHPENIIRGVKLWQSDLVVDLSLIVTLEV